MSTLLADNKKTDLLNDANPHIQSHNQFRRDESLNFLPENIR
ncbi:hypothetical protein [Listeria kieliensis]